MHDFVMRTNTKSYGVFSIRVWCIFHDYGNVLCSGDKVMILRLLRSHRPYGTPINRLTPNDPYMGRTAPLTSKRCILYIYSTNIGTEYFKNAPYSPFFPLQNAVCFIMLTCLVSVLFTFYVQGVLKWKK